jgi:hypothetical protein
MNAAAQTCKLSIRPGVYISKQSERDAIGFEFKTKTIKKDFDGHDTMEENCTVETFYRSRTPRPKGGRRKGAEVLQKSARPKCRRGRRRDAVRLGNFSEVNGKYVMFCCLSI